MLSKPTRLPFHLVLVVQPWCHVACIREFRLHTHTHTHGIHTYGSLVTVFPFGEKHGRLSAFLAIFCLVDGGKGATLSAANVFSKNCFDEETFAASNGDRRRGKINKQHATREAARGRWKGGGECLWKNVTTSSSSSSSLSSWINTRKFSSPAKHGRSGFEERSNTVASDWSSTYQKTCSLVSTKPSILFLPSMNY